MIDLTFAFEGKLEKTEPFVAVVGDQKENNKHIVLRPSDTDSQIFKLGDSQIKTLKENIELEHGEIVLIFPEQERIQRFFRPTSNSNTILLTEQCDQYCLMCSQPPKKKDYLYWDLYLQALKLVPPGYTIGISGGEPSLFKRDLFDFLMQVQRSNPHVIFHILTNGQHFDRDDVNTLRLLRENVLWGVPLYSHYGLEHDNIVGKLGAFEKLLDGFNILLKAGSRMELRTVLLKQNHHSFPTLANFVSKYFQWSEVWAIMQLEPMGFAKIDWESKFFDTTVFAENIEDSVLAAKASGINVLLYNFPKCTVPITIRHYCTKSISDWKQKYIECCDTCIERKSCCGFFDWYDDTYAFKRIREII